MPHILGSSKILNCNSVKFMIILTYVLVIINNKNCEQQQISDEGTVERRFKCRRKRNQCKLSTFTVKYMHAI